MRRLLIIGREAGVPSVRRILATLIVAAVVVALSPDARAAIVLGTQIGGVIGGNDSATIVSTLVGTTVTQLAKVELPATSSNGLTLSNIVFNSDTPPEPISGQWAFSGPGVVDYIAVKAGPDFVIFLFSDANTSNTRNIGLWNTALLSNKGLSHLTAYQIAAVPLPAALPLFASALAAFGFVGWRRRAQAA